MKKLALGALFVGLMAACGGGKDDVTLVPDAPPVVGVCNPIMQTGCGATEKCSWQWDQDTPALVGHIGCVPDGVVALGGVCTMGAAGATGFDNCVKGNACIARPGGTDICKQICDSQAAGAATGCDDQHACSRYSGFFTSGGMITAGVCDAKCDPLTQRLLVGTPNEACGSPDPAAPLDGCYRADAFENFACAGADDPAKTDGAVPSTDDGLPSGNAFINGCAAGFMPLFFESNDVRETRCSGSCPPGEISSVAADQANRDGVAAVPVKLVGKPAPVAGDGLCQSGKKGRGAAGSQNCLFIWPFLTDMNGVPSASTFNETLGFCFSFALFKYDSNQDMMITAADMNVPSCTVKPRRVAGNMVFDDDAADFGCQTIANTMMFGAGDSRPSQTKRLISLGKGAGDAVRHSFK